MDQAMLYLVVLLIIQVNVIASQDVVRTLTVNEDKTGVIITLAPDPPVGVEKFRVIEGLSSSIFDFNNDTGQVILKNGQFLDPPTASKYNFRVEVYNSNNANTIRFENITLEILDVKPTIIRTFKTKPLIEKAVLFQQKNTPENTVVIKITAQDVNPKTKFVYSYVPGREIDRFRITDDGRAVTVGSAVYPDDQQYILCIRATDSRNFRSYADVQVVVYTSKQPPVLSEQLQDLSLGEQVTPQTSFGEIQAMPINYVFDKLTYRNAESFFTDTNVPFSINSDGKLIKTRDVDYEALYKAGGRLGWLFITEVLENGTNPNYAVVRISLGDSNDNTPEFLTTVYVVPDVKEDVKPGAVITEIMPYDIDTDEENIKMTYSITGSTFFLVRTNPVNQKAQIYLAKAIDFDNQKVRYPFYDMTLNGYNTNGDKKTVSTKVRVYVSNANDNAPKFSQPEFTISVKSDAAVNSQVAFLQAWDIDGSTISYYFLNPANNQQTSTIEQFRIEQSTGAIFVTAQIIKPAYSLKVVAEDGGDCVFCSGSPGIKLKTVLQVNIKTTEINAHKPSFGINCPAELTVNEELDAGTTIGTVTATDGDPANSLAGQLSYSFIGNKVPIEFSEFLKINESTGVIQTTRKLNRESYSDDEYFKFFYFTVKVNDKGTPQRQSLCNFKLIINDINDNRPVFFPKLYMYVLKQNQPYTNVPILRLNTFDLDADNNANTEYRFIGTVSEQTFTVDNDGVVRYSGTQSQGKDFVLTVEARNSVALAGGATLPWATVQIKIFVRNDNNFQMPQITAQSGLSNFLITKTIREDVAPGILIETIRASIPTGATDYTLSWTNQLGPTGYLNSLERHCRFSDGEGLSSNLTTTSSPQSHVAEFMGIVMLSKSESNNVIGRIFTYIYVKVSVTDVNNQRPIFLNPPDDFQSIPETITQNEEVTKFFFIDLDRTIAFQESVYVKNPPSGGDGGNFNLNSNTGRLTIASPDLKGVGKSSFVFNVKVRNNVNSNKGVVIESEEPLNLKLSDVNDNPPIFTSCTVRAIAEDFSIDTSIGRVVATDSDVVSTLSYQIKTSSSSEQSRVHVNPSNGEIFSSYPLYLDSSSSKSYNYIIEVSDGINAVTCSLALDVNPVQFPPKFSQTVYKFTATETDANKVLGKVAATMNTGATGSSIRYTIEGKFAFRFSMNPATGDLTVISPLERDPPDGLDVYEISVKAVWQANNKESYALIQVTVTDVNDNPPMFLAKDLYYELPVSTPLNGIFATITTSDRDISPNTGTSFALQSGVYPNGVHPNITLLPNGAMQTKQVYQSFGDNPDFRDLSFPVKVVATSSPALCCGLPNTAVSVTIMVIVVDNTNKPPTFTPSSVTIQVPENSEIGRQIGSVRANDPDIADHTKLTYSYQTTIAGFSLVNLPTVNAVAFQLDRAFNYELPNERQFFGIVKVVDTHTTPHTATVSVTIQITNVFEPPTITATPASRSIPENSPKNTQITAIVTSNADSAHTTGFDFLVDPTTNPLNLFTISSQDSSSAIVVLNNIPDREALTSDMKDVTIPLAIILQPKSPNTGLPFRHIVPVTITDSNDNRPFLSVLDGYTKEKQPIGSAVLPAFFPIVDPDNSPSSSQTVASKAGSQSEGWQLFNIKRFINSTSGENGIQLENSGQLTATKLYKLNVNLNDNTNSGESTVRVLVLPSVHDTNKRYLKSVEIVIPETWTWFYKDKEASLKVTEIPTIFPNTPEDLANRNFQLIDSNTDSVKLYFRVTEKGTLSVLGYVRMGSYVVLVDATKPGEIVWKYQVTVSITFVPNESIQKSSSFRVSGILPIQFMAKIPDGQDVDSAGDSLQTQIRKLIATALGSPLDKVDFISVRQVPNQLATDVFFAVHGSPYYSPAILNAMLKQQSTALENILKSVNPALTLSQSPVDMCGDEGQALLKCPTGGCRTVYATNEDPDVKDSRLNAGIEAKVEPIFQCGCNTCVVKSGCTEDHCLNGGVCSKEIGTQTLVCTCRPGFTGPRCQQPHVTFVSPGGYSMYSGFPDGCSDMHVSFEFITTKDSGNQLLFYAGPLNEKVSGAAPVVPDFLSIILKSDGNVEISIDIGSGVTTRSLTPRINLRNNDWHRIDFLLKESQVVLILDLCANTPLVENNVDVDFSRCRLSLKASSYHKGLNLKGAPIQLGGRAPREPGVPMGEDHYPKIVSDSQGPFVGTFRNLRAGGKLIDLYSHKLQKDIQLNVAMSNTQLEDGCLNSERKSLCGSNAVCTAKLNGALGSGTCTCKAGYRSGSSGSCNTATKIRYLRKESLLRWRIDPTVQTVFTNDYKKGTELSLMFKSRKDGTLMTLDGFWNIYYKVIKLEIRILNSQLEFLPKYGDYKHEVLTLPNKNVSDGAWHQVRIKRVLRSVEIQMDDGEGCNYLFNANFESTKYNYFTPEFRAIVGALADPTPGVTLGSIQPVSSDLVDTCIQDVRINGYWLPVMTEENDLPQNAGKLEEEKNIEDKCPDPSGCPISCPSVLTCIPVWNPLYSALCACPATYQLLNNRCIPPNPCFPDPCFNVGRCLYKDSGYECKCEVGLYGKTEEDCNPTVAPIVGLAAGYIVLIVILILLLLALLIFLLWWFLCFKKADLLLPPDEDTRENIKNYDGNAGEIDTDNYDIAKLKAALHVTTTGPVILPPKIDTGTLLTATYTGEGAPPQDYTLDYGYEGQGSVVDELSLLGSDTTDASQNFDYLRNSGDPFNRLADLYNPRV